MSGSTRVELGAHLAVGWRDLVERARQVLGSREEAEDVVQDVVLRLLEAPSVLEPVERLGGWLLTVVRRRAIDALRSRSRRCGREVPEELLDLLEGVDDPGATAEADELAAAVAEEIAALPGPQREALVATALNGLTFRELSERTGTAMGTLMARKKRATDRLRARLIDRGLLPGPVSKLEVGP